MADGYVLIDTKLDPDGLEKGLNYLSTMASGAIGGLTKILAGAATALGTLGGTAVKIGSDFEAQMSRVLAISGATAEEFADLNALAKQLGADTSFSASEAAAGMENLASAGFTANEILAAMPGLLDLAAVSGGDVAIASEIAASALNAFGLEAGKAGHVANVFAQAAASTNAEAYDMGDALKYVGPVAHSMSLTLEETAAAIGLMADAGIKGSQAGTSLRGALSRIAKPTEIMRDTMDQLGLSFYDTEGNMISLRDQVVMLQTAFEGLTQEERNQALVTLYGQESLSGMLALIEAGPEKLDELTSSLEESSGAAAEMAATIQDNLQGDIEGLMGSLETLGITFYEQLNDPLRELVQLADGYIGQLQTAFEAEGFAGLVSSLGDILAQAVMELTSMAPSLVEAATSLIESFVSGLSENAPTVASAAIEIGFSLVEGLASLAGSLISLGAELIYHLLTGLIENLPAIADGAMQAIENFASSFAANLPVILEKGRELLNQLCLGIQENLPSLIDRGLDAVLQFSEALLTNVPTIIEAGFQLLSSLVQGVLSALPDLLAKGPEIISNFANVINNAFPQILKLGCELLWQIITGLISAIPDLIANIPKIITAIVDVWEAFNWLDLGKKAITLLKDGIMGMLSAVKNAGKSIMDGATNAMKNLPSNLQTLGRNAITFMSNGIKGMLGTITSAAKNIFNGIVNTLSSLPSKLVSIGSDLIRGLWNGISDMSGWVIGKIEGFCSNALGAIKRFFGISSPSRVFRDLVGKNLMIGLADGIAAEAQTAIDATEDAAEKIADVDFEPKKPDFPGGDWDYTGLVATVRSTVQHQNSETGQAVGATSANAIYRTSGISSDNIRADSPEGSTQKYIQNDIYFDGKKTARILTPYVTKELAWEGK